jgi:predicted O-methyltransferase YrrM
MGLSTVLGIRRAGFFIPYRYAAAARPAPYRGLEPIFAAAEPAMAELLAAIDRFAPALAAVSGPAPAPRFDQGWFPRLDAAAAYAMTRTRAPARIVEVGSGHSTRFLARAVADGGLATDITCIDPAPRAAIAALPVTHVPALVQDADPAIFESLAAGDMLFIDSSHIAMPGTDVDRLYGDILPRLAPGVLVHIHDVLLPDAYPARWGWHGYNEQLLVACLLQGGFGLGWSSHWMATRRAAAVAAAAGRLPLIPGTPETSVWLAKR